MPQDAIAFAERYGAKLPHAQGIPRAHPAGGQARHRQVNTIRPAWRRSDGCVKY
jgi:hypothetical protein